MPLSKFISNIILEHDVRRRRTLRGVGILDTLALLWNTAPLLASYWKAIVSIEQQVAREHSPTG